MIQFNLLPDVKKEYVKAKKLKRLIVSAATLLSIGSVIVVILLFSIVQIAQKKHIKDLSADIKKETSKIQSTQDLNKMLTVQNQLSLLTSLHEDKPETSRIFDYLAFVTPSQVKVTVLDLDNVNQKLIIQGNADTIASVNKFVDNLKNTQYSVEGNSSAATKAFTQVSTQLSGDSQKASFKIDIQFDKTIFNTTKEIALQLGGQSYSTKKGAQ